jgi:alkyl sulfatase BDS1-like metallo-beta-lactamase superfamily hydrolase
VPTIRELSEQLWNGEITTQDFHPVGWGTRAGEEIADGVLFYKGIASANTVDTGDGLVMLDTGAVNDTRQLYDEVRKWRPDAPLRAAVFSHHHVDHIFGVGPFEAEAREKRWARPFVYGHEHLDWHFDRYKRTLGWNTAINRRQFAIDAPQFKWQEEYRYPDVTYQSRMRFNTGKLTFELRHTRGETDDATWTWVPERKLLAPGDLFIWAVPNAGNPQKVQRYAGDWAAALRDMATCDAELMVPSHGLPVWGVERVRAALEDTATLLETLHDQTVELMNEGCRLNEILHTVHPPAELMDRPYLQPIYDDPEFIVRNVWRLYGGWYDGNPAELKPARTSELATELASLAGGPTVLADRAASLAEAGDLRLAGHLAELALAAAPDDPGLLQIHAAVNSAREAAEPSLMARGIFGAAARQSAVAAHS